MERKNMCLGELLKLSTPGSTIYNRLKRSEDVLKRKGYSEKEIYNWRFRV